MNDERWIPMRSSDHWARVVVNRVRYEYARRRKPVPPFTIVTGASQNHAAPLLRFLRSIQKHEPGTEVIVYDLGLDDDICRRIEAHFPLRRFDFERYPAFFDISTNAGEFAWKRPSSGRWPRRRPDNIVCWLDSRHHRHRKVERAFGMRRCTTAFTHRSAIGISAIGFIRLCSIFSNCLTTGNTRLGHCKLVRWRSICGTPRLASSLRIGRTTPRSNSASLPPAPIGLIIAEIRRCSRPWRTAPGWFRHLRLANSDCSNTRTASPNGSRSELRRSGSASESAVPKG